MIDGKWQQICVVGLGGHARTKILPAIAANGQTLAGIVSRNPASVEVASNVLCFERIDAALSKLPAETLFIVSTPPDAHFGQVLPLLEAGRDVLVEKPAFSSAVEARTAVAAARGNGAVLIEGFMNRYTVAHSRFLAAVAYKTPELLELVFTIPQAPADTFRTGDSVGSSNLFDMGCYLLAALSDAGMDLGSLEIVNVEHAGQPARELLHLRGSDGITDIVARIGVDSVYENSICTSSQSASFEISPFIYGRPGTRTVTTLNAQGTSVEEIEDVNAFEAMLGIPRRQWLENQTERFSQLIDVTTQLERLGKSLTRHRRDAQPKT